MSGYSRDNKDRWAGLLEIPMISKVQRNLLAGGRNKGFRRIFDDYDFKSVIDIGCGLGETSPVFSCPYVGIDNSFPRLVYAARRYPSRNFLLADALKLPFTDDAFDTAVMIDISHHLSDDGFCAVVQAMARLAQRYVVVSDPVIFPRQDRLSRFFYDLDRGGSFRTEQQMRSIVARVPSLEMVDRRFFTSFPGLYRHAVFILSVKTPHH